MSKKPNIVFMFSDQHRRNAMSIWQKPEYRDKIRTVPDPVQTPALDALADKGIVLSEAYSSYPVCSPYRAMLFSGMYPENNGVWQNCAPGRSDELKKDIETFTDALSDGGYSVGYVGKWHLEEPKPDFDIDGNYIANNPDYKGERFYPDGSTEAAPACWDTLIPKDRQRKVDYLYAYNTYDVFRYGEKADKRKTPRYWDKNYNRIKPPVNTWAPDFETDMAIKFIKNENGERSNEKPYALFLSYNPPHSPYGSRKDTDFEAYDTKYCKEVLPDGSVLLKRKNVENMDEALINKSRVYFSHVTGIDRCVGRVLDAVGDDENTIIVFTADHGEMMGSHGLMGKNVPYEEATAIPFIISYPEKLKHRTDDLMITGVDVMPTILSLAGVEIPKTAEGKDYSQLLITGEGERPEAVLYTQPKRKGVKTYKYQFSVERDTPEKYGEVLIFDLTKDPYQLNSLSPDEIPEEDFIMLRKELGKLLKISNDPWYQKKLYSDIIIY